MAFMVMVQICAFMCADACTGYFTSTSAGHACGKDQFRSFTLSTGESALAFAAGTLVKFFDAECVDFGDDTFSTASGAGDDAYATTEVASLGAFFGAFTSAADFVAIAFGITKFTVRDAEQGCFEEIIEALGLFHSCPHWFH